MAVKQESVSETRRTDIWRSNNTCMICQDHCPSREDKDKHENQTKHRKKLLIYEFFAKEVPKFRPFSGPSVLVKRYTACGEQVVGLECLHELHFSFSAVPWWACSICYESGALLEQADIHLTSMSHITTYLDEFHSSKTAALQMDGDRLKVFEEIKRLCDEVIGEQGGELLPPECMVMDAHVTEKDAMAKLAVDAERLKPSYRIHTDCTDEGNPRRILQCLICRQLVAVNDVLLKRIWSTHELSPAHRHAVTISQFLEQFDVEYILDTDFLPPKIPIQWKTENDCNYGPLCGIKFLVTFRKRMFCQLCCCEIESLERHFSCESHIMQFLTISNPVEMFRVSQFARHSGLKKALEIICSSKFRFENEQSRKVHADWFPKTMELMLKPESHVFQTMMPPLTPLGIDSACLFCTVCWLVVRVDKDDKSEGEAVWNFHCAERSHFEFAIRRACFGFDDGFFVPMSSNIPKAPWNLHGKWTQIKVDNEEFCVQTQSDVGLEFVVDDQENHEVICTLCARWFPRGMDQQINNHIRSYQHLNHYLHVTNRNLLSMLMVQKTEVASRELALEWLKRSIHNDMDEMRVYSPEMAMRMRQWGTIPIRKVDAMSYDSTHRPLFECVMGMVDKVADDGSERIEVPIKEALNAAGVKIYATKQRNGNIERILCRCTQCEMAFSTPIHTESIVHNIWDRHLASELHFGRIRAFMGTKLDMLGFSESTSSYTVKPFKQQDPSRKITWQWNPKNKTHEFVLNVIGLEDLVERRSNEAAGAHPPDFFCRLCAVVIPRRSAALEAHVRSAQHVMCYVFQHKYHPLTIMELDSLPKEGGKEMRKILAQLLKDHQLKEQYCIPIYDPIGEQERKGIVAMQKAKDEERQRQLAEARQKAQEQRKKKDEERRKQREIEMEQEKHKQAERARKEKEAKERTQRLEEEKAHVKKLLIEAARKAEEERKAKEAKEKAQEDTDRKKRQEQLRSLLDREKARLRDLQEKEAAQRRLLVEKQELEKKMQQLRERAVMQTQPSPLVENHPAPFIQNQPPPLIQSQVPPRNGPCTYASIPEPQLVAPNIRIPQNGLVNVSPEPIRQPLLGHAPPLMQNEQRYNVPPPTRSFNASPFIRETLETVGPKPLFPKFVPVAEQVPVYRGLEDAEKASRPRPKSPSPENSRVNVRPSIRDRKVDPYISNAKIIKTRDQLVDFIWRQGAERIPPNELPAQFNEKAAGIEGALGVDCLYEVVCADDSDLDTLYCSMCGVWTTPNDMFKHLETVEHKLAYLFRNYKMYHQAVVTETNSLVREAMLSQFAIQIWKMEKPPGQVTNRLRSLLDRATIERIWPEHVNVFDHSWKEIGKTAGRVEVPPPISKEAMCFATDDTKTEDKKGKEKKTKEEKREEKEEKIPKIKTEILENSDSHSRRKEEKEKKEGSSIVHSKKRSASFERKNSSSSLKPCDSRKSSSPERKRRRTRSREKRSSRNDKHSHNRSSSRSRRDRSSSHSRRDRSSSRFRRNHSSSRSRRDRRRSSSKDRSKHTRSRSRSSSPRHSRRKRSRSRSRSRSRGSTRTGKEMTWEETAAAFLAKLGEPKHATKPIDSPKEKEKKVASSKSFVNEKIKQLRNLANPAPLVHQKDVPETERGGLLGLSDSDEKAQMRKLLGVLITMQQEAEKNSNLDESVIDKLYKEVGLKKSMEASSDQLLAQICSQISQDTQSTSKPAIDLQSFGISAHPEPAPQQQTPSIFGGGFHPQPPISFGQPSTIQTLLSEVKRSLGNLNPHRPASPLIKPPPFVITNRDDVFPESETISYVFPGADSKDIHLGSCLNMQSEEKLSKKDRAALRRKMLLEEAERLRRQAEEEDGDDDDDDWDCLAEVINGPTPTCKGSFDEQPCGSSYEQKAVNEETSSQQKNAELGKYKERRYDDKEECYRRADEKEKSRDRKCDDKTNSHDRRVDDRERYYDRRSNEKEKDSKKVDESKKSSSTRTETKLQPVAPGQKMPLQRTILPNGRLFRETKKDEKRSEKEKEGREKNSAGRSTEEPSAWRQSARLSSCEVDKNQRKLTRKEKREIKEMRAKERAANSGRPNGNPSTWPQPVPQPLLGLSLERPPTLEQLPPPREQQQYYEQHYEQPPNQYSIANDHAYQSMANSPVYPNQYPPICMNQPPQQFQNPQYYPRQQYMGQPMGYGDPPMQQQYYGQPPYY